MATSTQSPLGETLSATQTASSTFQWSSASSLNQVKLQLSQLEWRLSRLAVCQGLAYGCLQEVAGCYLRVEEALVQRIANCSHTSTLVDLAGTLLHEASPVHLQQFERDLLTLRGLAADPAQQKYSPAYQSLMADLLNLEQQLQTAMQTALQCSDV